MGWDPAPAWLVYLAIPFFHAIALQCLKEVCVDNHGPVNAIKNTAMQTLLGSQDVTDELWTRKSMVLALFASAIMCVATFYVFLFVDASESGSVNNRTPRNCRPEAEPSLRGRLISAHKNHLENFPIFAASVLVALSAQKVDESASVLAWCHLTSRVAYVALYAFDFPNMRTMAYIFSFDAAMLILWRHVTLGY